jgi:hypothetical protein
MADDGGEISVQITAQIQGLMDGLNTATSGVKDSTAKMAASFAPLTAASASSFDSMAGQSKEAAESMEGDFSKTEARHAAHMLGMNRAVGGFVATLPGVGQALSMAFAPLAIMEMIEWIAKGVEKLMEFREESGKLAATEKEAGIESNRSFNSLNDKLLEAQEKTAELAGNQMEALRIKLELIDHASMNELFEQFESLSKIANSVFDGMAVHWFQFGSGAAGQKASLESFRLEYEELQTDVNKQGEAHDLLTAKLSRESEIFANLQKAQDAFSGAGSKSAGAYNEFEQAKTALLAKNVTLENGSVESLNRQVNAQRELLNILQKYAADTKTVKTEHDARSGNARTEAAKKDSKEDKDPSSEQMAALKENLDAQKALKENWFTWSTQREIEYWQTMATIGGLGAKALADIQNEIDKLTRKGAEEGEKASEQGFERKYSAAAKGSAERVQLATNEVARLRAVYNGMGPEYAAAQAKMTEATKEQGAQRRADGARAIDESLALQNAAAAKTVQLARDDAAAGIITKQQLLQAEHAYIAAVLSDEERAIQIKKILYAGDAEEFAKLMKLKTAEETRAAAESAVIDKKEAADHLKTAQTWVNGLTSGFSSGISGMIKGTQSFGQAFKSIMGSAMDFVIQQMVKMLARHLSVEVAKTTATTAQTGVRTGVQTAADAKTMASDTVTGAHHVAVEGAKTGSTLAGSATRVATEIWASLKTMALKLAEGIKWIAIEGWKAAASAWASISAIPVVGPFLAPAVAAGVVASVIALGMHMSSAAGGWDNVPSDQIAQIHKSEMILPASIANPLRSAIAGGGIGGNGGGGDTHLHIHGGVDSKAFFQQNQGNIMAAIKEAAKNRRG